MGHRNSHQVHGFNMCKQNHLHLHSRLCTCLHGLGLVTFCMLIFVLLRNTRLKGKVCMESPASWTLWRSPPVLPPQIRMPSPFGKACELCRRQGVCHVGHVGIASLGLGCDSLHDNVRHKGFEPFCLQAHHLQSCVQILSRAAPQKNSRCSFRFSPLLSCHEVVCHQPTTLSSCQIIDMCKQEIGNIELSQNGALAVWSTCGERLLRCTDLTTYQTRLSTNVLVYTPFICNQC